MFFLIQTRHLKSIYLPGIHQPLHSDWSAGYRWSLQVGASFQGCCYSTDVQLTPPLLQSMVTPPRLIPWENKKHGLIMRSQQYSQSAIFLRVVWVHCEHCTCRVWRTACLRDTADTAESEGRRPGRWCWWRPGPVRQSTPGCDTLQRVGATDFNEHVACEIWDTTGDWRNSHVPLLLTGSFAT